MLEMARKLEPGIGERFMLFVRDREQKQRQGAGGSDGSYDLLSYVEFQVSCPGRGWAAKQSKQVDARAAGAWQQGRMPSLMPELCLLPAGLA